MKNGGVEVYAILAEVKTDVGIGRSGCCRRVELWLETNVLEDGDSMLLRNVV